MNRPKGARHSVVFLADVRDDSPITHHDALLCATQIVQATANRGLERVERRGGDGSSLLYRCLALSEGLAEFHRSISQHSGLPQPAESWAAASALVQLQNRPRCPALAAISVNSPSGRFLGMALRRSKRTPAGFKGSPRRQP